MLFCWGRKRFPTGEEDKRAADPSPQLHIVLQTNTFLCRSTQGLNQNFLAKDEQDSKTKKPARATCLLYRLQSSVAIYKSLE